MNKNILNVVLMVAATGIVGCAEVDSKDIRTSGFCSEMQVISGDNTTSVGANLRTGRALDADSIVLSSGDQLTATMGGRSIALYKSDANYLGVFNQNGSGQEVRISLLRSDDIDAPDSRVVVPIAFEITAPDQAETFNAGESISVAWTPGSLANTVSVDFFVNCQVTGENGLPTGAAYGRGYQVPDSGTHTASINQILDTFGSREDLVSGIACPMTVSVTRLNEGTLDRALTKGGTIMAKQEKSVLVNVIP